MKKTAIALALALTLTGALTSCGRDRPAEVHSGGTNVSAGQATRQTEAQAKTRDFLDDGRYVAWDNGHVHSGDGNPVTRDLTRSARDMIADYTIIGIKTILRNADITIKDVVRHSGFSSQSSFSRFFRKHTGMSPSEYRRTIHILK